MPAPAQSPPVIPEPDIKRLVGQVRRENVERTIRTLVGFGTRNTLSTQNDPRRGIGAARDYLYDEFLQPVAARVPQPTNLTNVIATLPGDAPAGQERYVIVSGHYDSMCANPTDGVNDAPGANGTHDDKTIRVFSEGIPTNKSAADVRTRQSVGGENDSYSRQLARFIAEVGRQYVKQPHVTLISRRDRYGRGGDHIPFNERGYAAVRFTEPNEDFTHQHQNVRSAPTLTCAGTPSPIPQSQLRDRLARHDHADLDPQAERRQSHQLHGQQHLQGQLHLRRPRC